MKSVVLYHKAAKKEIPIEPVGAYAPLSQPEEGAYAPLRPPQEETSKTFMVNDIHVVKLGVGMVMADTGCKKAVGGTQWHRELQYAMDKIGKSYKSFEMSELFQFGPGQPLQALKGWRYNVGINGRNEIFTIAEIDVQLPGLCGPDDMAKWNMKLDFTDGTLETYGNKGRLQPYDTGHPCASLLEYPDNETEWFQMTGTWEDEDDDDVVPSENENFPAEAESDDDAPSEVASSTDSDMSGSGIESSHAHSSDESFESSSEESGEPETIFEIHPFESENP